jgi:hypothetical protein
MRFFQTKTTDFGQSIITTFDLAIIQRERGPYNFERRSTGVNANGNILNPSRHGVG